MFFAYCFLLGWNEYTHKKRIAQWRELYYIQQSFFYQAVAEAYRGMRIIHQMKTIQTLKKEEL
jgi:hypothetical protein